MATRNSNGLLLNEQFVNYNFCDDATFSQLEEMGEILQKTAQPHGQKLAITKIALKNDIESGYMPIMMMAPKVLYFALFCVFG